MNIDIKSEMISAREEYIQMIKSELLGPGSEFPLPDVEHELISTSPTNRYSLGILYPQQFLFEQDNGETIVLDEEPDEDDFYDVEENESSDVASTENNPANDVDTDENLDEEMGLATQYWPASMGITFLAKGDVSKVKGRLRFATYRKAVLSDCVIPYEPGTDEFYTVPSELSHIIYYDNDLRHMRLRSKIDSKHIRELFEKDTIREDEAKPLERVVRRLMDCIDRGYVRVPHEIEEFVCDFSEKDYSDEEQNQNLDGTDAKVVAVRRNVGDDVYSVSVMFVNNYKNNSKRADSCIFQPEMEISTDNNKFIFTDISFDTDFDSLDEEEISLELLYRNKKNYATGLGVSADWDINEFGEGVIKTDFFPVTEVPSMDFNLPENELIGDRDLSMKYLSDLDESSKDEKLNSLKNLVDMYKNWVLDLEAAAATLDPKYSTVASKNISECKRAYERMYSGIETLTNDDDAYNAFLLSNRAMFMQRVHIAKQSALSTDRYPGDEDVANFIETVDYRDENDSDCKWRPFQIAFLLMDINSITCDECSDRDLVDLIWFPTGGGKTEAYLGLTAFTIFYRRLAHLKESSGTVVIMRYTLRLLASQQFTRAATLICACEYIRQDCLKKAKKNKYPRYDLGKEEITIGLWIGGDHIPNNNTEAEECLLKLRGANTAYSLRYEKERNNKFQVLKCPWCGTKMVKDDKDGKIVGEFGYSMKNKNHFYMFCPHEACDFTKKLPIQIIDKELYNSPPTLLFGTVDKFAMMPWDGRIGAFFGVDCDNRAPELIIQDELHLISGSLGTIVGLYETAIDYLCGMKGVAPKIIASTATIRRAKEQCSALYNRSVVQFPAPGLDAEDSFFARESVIDYEKKIYGRKYVGLLPAGKTKVLAESRAMAAMLQKVYTFDLPEEVKDKFWTLTAYYNSLKDLGKGMTLVEDDVKDFINRTANRMFTTKRPIVGADELTSRVTTTELNETLDKLEKVEYSAENIENHRYASNVLLATNMISVGIDIARLNVMLMVGQPKLTSEYIQASSRVGRSFPGVVFVQYDATKSRDRSYYERFKSYHESFYKYVEPTGATPFSKPARDRGLHAVVVTMLRYMESMIKDSDAANFDVEYFAESIDVIKEFILNRAESIDSVSGGYSEDYYLIKSEIEEFLEEWQQLVGSVSETENRVPLVFGRRFMMNNPTEGEKRLFKSYGKKSKDYAKDTLTSMRNVDAQIPGTVVVWEEDDVRTN